MNLASVRTILMVSFFVTASSVFAVSEARAWRSALYPVEWTPPESLATSLSFETDKIIQDFSYAGYRRSEVALPEIAGPVFNVVEDFGADPRGDSDTTTAIQGAIDAASAAGGGVVFLPAGTYRVRPQGNAAASLRIRSSNVVLRGAGPGNTFVFNDSWQMRNKDIIRVDSPGSGWATVPQNSPVTSITRNLLGPSVEIPLASVEGFAVGDWIVLRADASEPFKAEHQMEDMWGGQNLGAGVLFIRQVVAIDEGSSSLTIDVPTRYYLKTRDNARVHLLGPHIDEVGLENFSIGNIEHPNHGSSNGWGLDDHSVEGTNAYDVHGSYALRLTRVRNSWVKNVRTYRPPQNSLNAHVLSNAMHIGNSVAVTVKDCHFQRALYSGKGGNAYMVRITNAQEVLVEDTVVGYNRHGFVFSHMQTSGNVILRGRAEHTGWRAIAGGAGSSGSDHHMHLSQSNLIDNTQLRQDYFAAYYRHTYGSNHGQTAAHTVYWNLEGLAYYGSLTHIVNTQQARYGYAIGTRGAAPGISTAGVASFAAQAYRTNPADHVEGQGMGASLEPRSLFEDQLRRRRAGPSSCLFVGDTWQSSPIASQTGEFVFEFEATPQSAPMNSVMGVSAGDAGQYQDLAAIARFSPEGVIDARNGGSFEADAVLAYSASTRYQFRFVVDVVAGTYDVYVRPEGAAEVAIARGYRFRTEQAGVWELNRFGSFAGVGENQICALNVRIEDEVDVSDLGEDVGGEPAGDVGDMDASWADDAADMPGPGLPGPGQPGGDAGGMIPDAATSGDAEDALVATSTGCACSSAPGVAGEGLVYVFIAGLWVIRRRMKGGQAVRSCRKRSSSH